ncbi:MAG: hypothetical protein AAF715_32605, partial [Myxococcota bacterium]
MAQPVDQEMEAVAKDLFREAVMAFDEKNYARCRARALAAYKQQQHPRIAGLLGSCQSYLGQNQEAATNLRIYLDSEVSKEDSADFVEKYEARLQVVKSQVGALTVRRTPASATVTVDGRDVPGDEAPVFVSP